ncbi:hypothetical protein BJY01DRAFT_248457 [Aspergillus pseudoustus]|uniref:Uncharacterized protein n=1 Tax=Aspergillus pseudoustus TaxID=1810923 RepID=A0ABR4JWD6_9EURO
MSASFDELEATMKKWEDYEKDSPTVHTPGSAQQPSTPASARVSTPTPAGGAPTPVSATTASTASRPAASASAYGEQSSNSSQPIEEKSIPEVPSLRPRPKPPHIGASRDISGHIDIADEGRPASDVSDSDSESDYPTQTPASAAAPAPARNPNDKPRLQRDGAVHEAILEFDFRSTTPEGVLEADDAMKQREATKADREELETLTETVVMMELFLHAENALTAEDVDRTQWKAREGLALAQKLKDKPYIARGEYILELAAALEKKKMTEAYERIKGVKYVATGDEEEGESEGEDDDEVDDIKVIGGWDNMAEIKDKNGPENSKDNQHVKDVGDGAAIPTIDTEKLSSSEQGQSADPQSRAENSGSPTSGNEGNQALDAGDEEKAEPQKQPPTDNPQKQTQKKKNKPKTPPPKPQYVKPRPIVLPTVYQSWEDPCPDCEEETSLCHSINRKRGRPSYSETSFWSYLVRLKSLGWLKSKPSQIRKRMLRALPRVWYTPDGNVDIDRPPPPESSFHSVFWDAQCNSVLMKEPANDELDWVVRHESTPFSPPHSEFTFRAHIPCSMMGPRTRPTEIFPEQEYEFLADKDDLEDFKEGVGAMKLDMKFLEFERLRVQEILKLKKQGLLPLKVKKERKPEPEPEPAKKATWAFDFSLISWVKLLILLFFLYWFCFGFWKVGLLKRIPIPVWNPFKRLCPGYEEFVLEPLRFR